MSRRNDVTQNTPAELAIREAMRAVEALPADERLTAAVVFLDRAHDAVADYVDGVPVEGNKGAEAVAAWCAVPREIREAFLANLGESLSALLSVREIDRLGGRLDAEAVGLFSSVEAAHRAAILVLEMMP